MDMGAGMDIAPDTSQKTDEATTPREGSASGGSGVKRARKSYRDRTFIHSDSQRKREFEKQMQILKDRSAALNASTGADVVLGVVNKEGHPVLWCTPNLHDFMVRDCDFNHTAPAAVTVARMVEAKRAVVAGNVAELPLEDKTRALGLALLKLLGGPFPPDGTAPNVIRVRLPWYPATYPFKNPMSLTELDVDAVTGELIADVLLKEVMANFDLEQFATLLQTAEGFTMEGVQSLLVCIRKFRSSRLATLAPSEVQKRFKAERAPKPKPVTHAKPAGPTTVTAVAVRPPPDPHQCQLVWLEQRPFLGERATTEQVTQCLAHEPTIKYNKGGTVKVGGNAVNLFELYNEVREVGGEQTVTDSKGWKKVASTLGLMPCNADISRSLRNTYHRYLNPICGMSPLRGRTTLTPVLQQLNEANNGELASGMVSVSMGSHSEPLEHARISVGDALTNDGA